MLSQIKQNEKLHLVAYIFKKIFFAKCNYKIYDKKLLTIIKAFEKYRFKCFNTSINFLIKILTNYKNLKYFIIFKQLNRKQIK